MFTLLSLTKTFAPLKLQEPFCFFLIFLAKLMPLLLSGVNKFIHAASILRKELALFIVGNSLYL